MEYVAMDLYRYKKCVVAKAPNVVAMEMRCCYHGDIFVSEPFEVSMDVT